ncbi:protein phosphatase 2C domain-containing protein [Dactylosporangium sp. NPDC049140]|uniref:protein phosphatase 2C domain-containing protein n=1 Tax=Dactylosporangium sp. NPDC049140 TaxID=3155647 RepID=UPI0033C8D11A
MTGSEAPATAAAPERGDAGPAGWWRHENGRWVVGDAGRQPEIMPAPPAGRAGTRPDTVIDGGHLGGLAYRASSQRGLGHQQLGAPRQDAYLLRPTPDRRWLVGCVADGVSEGPLSHEAADLVCQETTARLARALSALPAAAAGDWARVVATVLPWAELVDEANAAVSKKARAAVRESLTREGDAAKLARFEESVWTDGDARKVMSSTAVVFAVSTAPDADGAYPAAIAVLAGDSTALLLDGDEWTPLAAVKNDGAAVASSAVEPLPGAVRVVPLARVLRTGQAIVVITDGLGDPLGSGGGVVGRFLAEQWRTPPDLLGFAQQLGFYRKSFTDDRTAVVIWADAAEGGS